MAAPKSRPHDLLAEVERAKAHYLEVLGVLPEPIRAMAEYAPQALVAYQQFKDYLYQPPGQAALDLKTKELIYVVLDSATGAAVMALLQELNQQDGRTVLLVTHDPGIAAASPRRLRFADGRLVADERSPQAQEALA